MKLNKKKNIVLLIAAIFLFVALFDGWPYGFFTLLRFVVFASSAYVAWMAYEAQKEKWVWIFGFLAVLFNPFIVIHFNRELWSIVDLFVGIFMVVSIFVLKLKNKPSIKEIKAVIEILDEADRKFKNDTFEKILKPKIEKIILSNPKKLKQTIEKTILAKEWVYGTIANISGDLLESGEYHIYRGVLASDFDGSGPGKDLLKIFDEATDELVKIGNIKKEWAEEQKKQLRKNIKNVG